MTTHTRIRELIELLHDTDQELEELLDGEIDSVTNSAGRTILLRRAQGHLRDSEAIAQAAVLSAIPSHIALVDNQGVIRSVNENWMRFERENNSTPPDGGMGIGANYLEICDRASATEPDAAIAAEGLRAVLAGRQNGFSFEYRCDSPQEQRWYKMAVAPLPDGNSSGAVVMHSDISARKRAALELALLTQHTARRERMLSTLLSSIGDFASIFDRGGRFLFVNQPLLDAWGLTLDQVVGRTLPDLGEQGHPPAVAQRMHRQVQEVFATGASIRDERVTEDAAGTRHYEYIMSPALAPDGSVDFVVGSTRDVTKARAAEQVIRASQQQLRHLIDGLSPSMFVGMLTPAGIVVEVNRTPLEAAGLSASDVLGKHFADTYWWSHSAAARQQLREAIALAAQGTPSEYEVTARGAKNHLVEIEFSLQPLRGETGEVIFLIPSATVVTERKRAETALRESEAQFRTLAESVPQIVWITTAGGSNIYFNQQFIDYSGMTREESRGYGWNAVFHPEDAPRAWEAWRQAVADNGIYMMEGRLRRSDGAYRWWLIRGLPQRDGAGDGANAKWLGTCTDIHDIKMAELEISQANQELQHQRRELRELNEELEARVKARTAELNHARDEAEHANQAKSTFLATMSHEIRTPMNGIFGLLELLALSELDAEQRMTLLAVQESGQTLLRIINDILDFSRIEADALELHLAGASVREAVEATCRLHRQVASSKNLTLTMDVSADISPVLDFDALRLGQILNNLVNNAIKFTEAGTISVTVDLVERSPLTESLRFVVRDTGIGISSEHLARLFQPFVQAGADVSTRFGGTGLGLVISLRLAELMGGSLQIESEPGKGTAMTLLLTFGQSQASARVPPRGRAGQDALEALLAGRRTAPGELEAEEEGTLLLVVDDHPTNLMVLTRQLASLGYAAHTATDGNQALSAWKSRRYGAVITDCNMPGMSGYQLTTAIRALEAEGGNSRTPIIACTANALPGAAAMCLELGMDACLVKPAGLAQISAALDRWVPLTRMGARLKDLSSADLPPAIAGGGLVDFFLLAEISGGNVQAQAEILAEFRRASSADADDLRRSVQADDRPLIVQCAHRLKGASLMLGANKLAAACDRIETDAAQKDTASVSGGLADFEAELRHLHDYFDTLL